MTAVLFQLNFSAETSTYQRLKLILLHFVPLTKDAVHIYLGFACLVLTAILFRRPLSSFKLLLPGLALSLAMEVVDLRDGYRQGEPHWRGSVHDVVNTNLIPTTLVLLCRKRRLRTG